MPKPRDVAAATKADIKTLMDELGKLYEANERWKNEIVRSVDSQLAATEERTKRHFDVVVEEIRHDLVGANHDTIELPRDRAEGHENRITRLEQRADYAAG